jgi:hypothetical protein
MMAAVHTCSLHVTTMTRCVRPLETAVKRILTRRRAAALSVARPPATSRSCLHTRDCELVRGDHFHRICPCGHRWVEQCSERRAVGARSARPRARLLEPHDSHERLACQADGDHGLGIAAVSGMHAEGDRGRSSESHSSPSVRERHGGVSASLVHDEVVRTHFRAASVEDREHVPPRGVVGVLNCATQSSMLALLPSDSFGRTREQVLVPRQPGIRT